MIRDMISWYMDKQEICDYVLKVEEENTALKETIKQLKNPDILVLFPAVRGRRFKDIIVPEWFQLEDDKKLLLDFKNYIIKEVYPTKRYYND